MSDTPETEKAWIPQKGETNLLWHKRQHSTSKKLERERNQAISDRNELKQMMEMIFLHEECYDRGDAEIATMAREILEKLKETKINNL